MQINLISKEDLKTQLWFDSDIWEEDHKKMADKMKCEENNNGGIIPRT
jgi:hypothetical protein